MNKEHKIGIVSLISLAIFAVVILLNRQVTNAVESYFGTAILNNYTATTTMACLTGNGLSTSTFAFDTWNADQVDAWLEIKASSTASQLAWEYEYSNNRIDWAGEDAYTVASNISITHSSTTPVHTYRPNNSLTPTTTKIIQFPNFSSNQKRLKMYVPLGAANVCVYAEFNIKRNAQ